MGAFREMVELATATAHKRFMKELVEINGGPKMEEPKKFKNAMTLLAEIETLYDAATDLAQKERLLENAIEVHTAFGSVEGAIASARDAYYRSKESLEKNAALLEKIHQDYKNLLKNEKALKEAQPNA